MTKAKTMRRWGLVVAAALATVTSIACSGNDTNYPTQPPARNVKSVETTFVTADFDFEPSALTVIFTDLSTGNVEKYVWSFGDGKKSTERNPVHTYRVEGTYTVGLSVSNDISADSVTKFVDVTAEEAEEVELPTAAFTTTTSETSLKVVFKNDSENAESFSWDFGDGTGSSAEHPVHTYAAAGTYVVTLTASNSHGSDSFSEFVTVPQEVAVPAGD